MLFLDSEKKIVFTGEGFNSGFTKFLCTPDNPLKVLRFHTSVQKKKVQQFFFSDTPCL